MQCRRRYLSALVFLLLFIAASVVVFDLHRPARVSWPEHSGTDNALNLFFVALIFNNGDILDNWAAELLKVVGPLKTHHCKNVYVSVLENGDSSDGSAAVLLLLERRLADLHIPSRIETRHVLSREPDRIRNLAKLRNHALDPLRGLDWNHRHTRIVFLNDIYFKAPDIFRLILTNGLAYDVACGLDYYYNFYDDWVARDIAGNRLLGQYPHFRDGAAVARVVRRQPVRVFSCWNGAAVLRAAPFLGEDRIRFRESMSLRGEPRHSECFLLFRDLWGRGYNRIVLNPDVKVAYSLRFYLVRVYLCPFFVDWVARLYYRVSGQIRAPDPRSADLSSDLSSLDYRGYV